MCKGCAGLKARLRETTHLMGEELKAQRGATARITEDRDHLHWALHQAYVAAVGSDWRFATLTVESAVKDIQKFTAAYASAAVLLIELGYRLADGGGWEAEPSRGQAAESLHAAALAGMGMTSAKLAGLGDRNKPHAWKQGEVWFCINMDETATGFGLTLEDAYRDLMGKHTARAPMVAP